MSRLALISILTAASLLSASSARADDEQEAQRLFTEGIAAFDAGDLETAKSRYESSLSLHPTAAAAFNLAGVLSDLSRPIAARAMYEELARGIYGELEDEQRREVQALAEATRAAIARIEVRVASGEPVTVEIDGEAVGAATEAEPVTHSVDPGRHVVRGERADGQRAEREVDVRAGGLGRALLRFEGATTQSEAAEVVSLQPEPEPGPEDDDEGGGVSPVVWVIAGAAVLLAGGVTLGIVLATSSSESGTVLPATGTLVSF